MAGNSTDDLFSFVKTSAPSPKPPKGGKAVDSSPRVNTTTPSAGGGLNAGLLSDIKKQVEEIKFQDDQEMAARTLASQGENENVFYSLLRSSLLA